MDAFISSDLPLDPVTKEAHPGGAELTRRMLKQANFTPGARVMDVCCGAGAAVRLLLEAGYDARGIDVTPAENGLPLVQGSAYNLPDMSLDGVLCECGFSLLEPDRALDAFARALKDGGTLLLSDLYSRAEGGQAGPLRVHTREQFEVYFKRHGLDVFFFEDCTDQLKSFMARQIMEHGSYGLDAGITELRALKCGYCFFAVRKIGG